MSQLLASTATRPPAFRDHVDTDHTVSAGKSRSRLWTLIEALAYAGAFIDPFGILAVERLRQAKEADRDAAR